jgi:aminopeptidase N
MGSIDPHSFSQPGSGSIQHIDLHLVPDFESRTVKVRSRYTLDRPLSGELHLDGSDLHIERIHSGRGPLHWSVVEQDPIRGQHLVLAGLDNLRSFEVDLTTSPQAGALQWLNPEMTTGGRLPYLYSQCQAIRARSIFPCQDTPSVRFTYRATIETHDKLTPVMAAKPLGSESRDGRTLHTFVMEQPIPSYLFAFAVGDLRFRPLGQRTGVYAEPAILEAACWEFAETELILQAAEALFGAYAWERYDLLIMPPSFPTCGMENPRLTFTSPTVIVGDRSEIDLVAHELAHAWTGNLVTNATWEDLWLNEGWTTYAERRILEVLRGEDFANLLSKLSMASLMADLRRFGPGSDRTKLKASLTGVDPDEAFSDVPYVKGHYFLVALEQAVGRATFDSFLRDYIWTNRFRTMTTEAFADTVRRSLPSAAAKIDLERWLYAPGLPADAPVLRSPLYDDVLSVLELYRQGRWPAEPKLTSWSPLQARTLLWELPDKIPAQDCARFAALLRVDQSRSAALLGRFLQIAIRSGWKQALPSVERLLASVGRELVVVPLYRAMAETEWSRPLVRELYRRNQAAYHPVIRELVLRALAEADV